VVAESMLVKHQLLILNRSRTRSPNLRSADRVIAGMCALFMRQRRLIRSAIVLKPATLLSLHRALTKRKYRRLFSPHVRSKPGPKGPTHEVRAAVVDMKQRNPTWGCPRIAQQMAFAFGIPINKDVVRRILAARNQPQPDVVGPSWLTVLGHAKDSLWSLDLFRCESAVSSASRTCLCGCSIDVLIAQPISTLSAITPEVGARRSRDAVATVIVIVEGALTRPAVTMHPLTEGQQEHRIRSGALDGHGLDRARLFQVFTEEPDTIQQASIRTTILSPPASRHVPSEAVTHLLG
jgi:hypothetical protein